ncbi:MAG: SpoIIE family protein phosphatase [Acidobacteria bacterium]|nr:SpoIIE family protein phosphatase [Acidobacteriota bacterium]
MNPALKRIRSRLIWMSLLGLVMAIGSFIVGQWIYARTDDQCTWRVRNDKVIILEILPDGVAEEAGLLEGDELLKIQGRRVAPTQAGLNAAQGLIDSKPEGTVLSYVIKREGEELSVPVRLVKPFNSYQFSILLNAIIFWFVSLLVVMSTPERKSSRHFFYLGCMGLLMAAGARGTTAAWPQPLAILAGLCLLTVISLGPPLCLHFFLRFPHPFELRKNRTFLALLYGGFVLLGLWLLVAPGVAKVVGLKANEIQIPLPVVISLCMAAVGFGVAFFTRGWRLSSPAQRQVMALPLAFTYAILVDICILGFLGQVTFKDSLLFGRRQWIFMAPMAVLPLSFGWAIVRHGLFEVRKALIRWLGYFFVLGTALTLYLAGLALLFGQGLSLIPPAWAGALVGVLALPLGWALRALLRTIRRRFKRDISSTREILLGSLRESKQRLSDRGLLRNLEEAVKEAFRPQILLLQRVEGAALALPALDTQDEDGQPLRLGPAVLIIPANLLRHARDNRELVLGLGSEEADWIREQGPEVRALVDALDLQLLVLFLAHDQPHSALLIGGKYADLGYGREDRELLRELALAAGGMLETALLHHKVIAQERIEQELATARRIQEGLLPKVPQIPGFQVALRLEPAMETGGDLLFVKRRPSGRWIAAVGDISGKGLAAALYMAQATALLELASCREDQSLEEMLEALDQTLRVLLGQRGFLTLAVLEWDEEGCYSLARAGHPGALLMESKESFEELYPHGRGLGLRPAGPGDWAVQRGQLPPGGWLILYSDGLTEAMDRKGDLYGLDRMRGQLQRLWATGSVRAACEAIFTDVAHYETQNRDDRTLFILGREAGIDLSEEAAS